MKEKIREVFNHTAPFVRGAYTLFCRAFVVAVAVPAVMGMLLLTALSGGSFAGAGQVITDIQVDAQQLGKASPGYLNVKRCTTPRPEGIPKVPDAVCRDWAVEEMSIQSAADNLGEVIFGIYLVCLFMSAALVFLAFPQTRLKLRERAFNSASDLIVRWKQARADKSSV
ncbi:MULTISPECIES: hypothetical protein [Pseudomonas syringae group]|uniref:hypothetical protein n=1 Tax=Pseudomonas syringae group TaxID=136849 RepID=UPI0006B89679|nr:MULTISPECIES: hypothetical protein [Pseudomonas syringae group]NAP32504.1 hypothetical protein [Pseudomonas syringae]